MTTNGNNSVLTELNFPVCRCGIYLVTEYSVSLAFGQWVLPYHIKA